MAVRIEKDDGVWTVIHSRLEARGAMDPESATALHDAFLAFDADNDARVAVFWGERDALRQEWRNSKAEVNGGVRGAARFSAGKGRGGDFGDI